MVRLVALMLLGCAPARQALTSPYPDVKPGRYVKAIKSGGLDRTYILRVPKAYDASKPTPLLVVFHGWTGSGAESEGYTHLAAAAEAEGWLSAFPDGTNTPRGWNTGFLNLGQKGVDDVRFTSDLLDAIKKQVHVDDSRVFVAGHSNGAMLAHTLASRLPDKIAAIGAVAGTVGLSQKARISAPNSPVSVMMIHGTGDSMVAYDAKDSALLRCISAPEGARWWAKQDKTAAEPVLGHLPGRAKTETWTLGTGGTEVVLVTLPGWSHDWPTAARTGGVDAASLLISFFKAHPKR